MINIILDHIYDQQSSQKEVYENTAKAAVLSTMEVAYK